MVMSNTPINGGIVCGMVEPFSISRTEKPDGPLRKVSPRGIEYPIDIEVPMTMQRRVTYPETGLSIVLNLVCPEERIEIRSIEIDGGSNFIATQHLTGLSLPKVIRQVAIKSIPNSDRWVGPKKEADRDFSPRFLAEMYWFEHLSWGTPRSAIMEHTGWSRANTNWHLRKIAKDFPLPGPPRGITGSSHSHPKP